MTVENTIPLFKVFMSEAASENVSDILSSGYITQGPEVDKFENVLKNYFNNENVVTTKLCYFSITFGISHA